jgi:hypothetical protein
MRFESVGNGADGKKSDVTEIASLFFCEQQRRFQREYIIQHKYSSEQSNQSPKTIPGKRLMHSKFGTVRRKSTNPTLQGIQNL